MFKIFGFDFHIYESWNDIRNWIEDIKEKGW